MVVVGHVNEKGAIPVTRGTPLGNPFPMNHPGERDLVCDKYEGTMSTIPVNLTGMLWRTSCPICSSFSWVNSNRNPLVKFYRRI